MVATGEGDPENLIRVEIELWLGLEEDLGGVFQRISPVRSRAVFQLASGTSVGELFSSVAREIPLVCQRVFNAETRKFSPEVVVIKNDAVASGSTLSEEKLSHGDRILIVPVYLGG
ncbi:MAG: MoaD/ThiS family protein [Thermodesulfobacteriota bacterium]